MSDARPFPIEEHMGSQELTEELIRQRAYSLYEQRGCQDGHALDDWLRAEAEIYGKNASEMEPLTEERTARAVAA